MQPSVDSQWNLPREINRENLLSHGEKNATYSIVDLHCFVINNWIYVRRRHNQTQRFVGPGMDKKRFQALSSATSYLHGTRLRSVSLRHPKGKSNGTGRTVIHAVSTQNALGVLHVPSFYHLCDGQFHRTKSITHPAIFAGCRVDGQMQGRPSDYILDLCPDNHDRCFPAQVMAVRASAPEQGERNNNHHRPE